jgi:hypothetical protein
LPVKTKVFVGKSLVSNRSLSRGNPNPGAIGTDFNRLGVAFWTEVDALDDRNERRREMLQELMQWRNAIAHQDFDPISTVGNASLHIARVRAWRRALGALAHDFDKVLYNYLGDLTGNPPW